MCVNYIPATRQHLIDVFRAPAPEGSDWPTETYQDYLAPIIRLDNMGARETLVASFGIIPKAHLPDTAKHFSTMNARSETVGQLRSFSAAWKSGQLALIPCEDFFEPNWETGRHVRWRIGMADHAPFAIAGLWRQWQDAKGDMSHSFTQLTVNADEHPLMARFHRPGSEKRSLVIVPREEYAAWLECRDPEVARTFLRAYPLSLMRAEPAPMPARRRIASNSTDVEHSWNRDLFG